METYESICIGCGKPVEFRRYDIGDIAEIDYEVTDQDEVGWWDHECSSCDWYTDYDVIELRIKGGLEGYCCCLETADEVRNFARLLFKEHPELFDNKKEI
jgi:hypothetical protein